MRLKRLVLWFALLISACTGQPLYAQSGDTGGYKPLSEKEAEAGASSDEIVRQTEAYGDWVLRLYRAVEPADTVLQQMSGEWQSATASGSYQVAAVQMRPFLVRARATIAQSQADVAAIDIPRFDAMGLDDDLQPAAVRDQVLQILRQYDEIMIGFTPLFQALIDRNEQAGVRATTQLLRSVRSLYEGQRLLSRTQLALIDEGSVDHLSTQFDVAFFETGIRAIDSAIRLTRGESDPQVSTDLIRIADRMDEIIDDAVLVAVADKAAGEQKAAESSPDDASILRQRSQRIDAMSNEAFGIWRRFSAGVRQGAQAMPNGPRGINELRPVTNMLAPTRQALDALALRQIEVLAGDR